MASSWAARYARCVSWFLVRQDTHGTRFDVARYATEDEANDAMADFEAGYPHHQTYYVEHRYTGETSRS